MILVIDNYDSFTYNLVQYLEELGARVMVVKNDQLSCDDIETMAPEGIVISPGPGYPDEAGICLEVIQRFTGRWPILGVCLGHQAIAQSFGADIVVNWRMMHGKISAIHHDGQGILREVKNPFDATRYHSLVVDASSLPSCLEVSAWSEEGEIMGVRHRQYPVEGIQFHPESILTENGKEIVFNFLLGTGTLLS
ncbi:MAG: aminodeoxychorismate/anthranilate synthase component II [Firmicutes bacterium HGW-Firmicutes-15]|nr:MAG: aminodeoxychorismate/anthranilate synthase component II [Firmicutes bacterium HGW-Firmicutes-15]